MSFNSRPDVPDEERRGHPMHPDLSHVLETRLVVLDPPELV
jgi:hypothetical protein